MDKFIRGVDSKEDLNALRAHEFIKQTDEKALRHKIHDLVDLAQKVRKEELEKKRHRLSLLLTTDDFEYEKEYAENIQAQAKEEFEAKQSRLKEIDRQHRRENENIVQLKKIQQHMNNCETIRQKLRNDTLKDTKQCQLLQIEEKKQKVLQVKEFNRNWDEMNRNRSQEEAKIVECKELEKRQQIHCYSEMLRQQMENKKILLKKLRTEERKDLLRAEEELKAAIKLDTQKEIEDAARKFYYAKQLQAQHNEALVLKIDRIEAEKKDRMFQESIDNLYQQDQKEIEAKVNRLREATLTYLNYLQNLKAEKARENRELELMTRELQDRTIEEKERKLRELKEKKALAAKEAHDELLKQIYANQMRHIKEKEREYIEAQEEQKKFEFEACQDIKKQRQRQEQALNYGKELQQQISAIKWQQAKQRADFEKDLVKSYEDDEFCKSLVSKLMSSSTHYLRSHPNWSLINCSCTNNN